MRKEKVKTIISLFDIHYPYNMPLFWVMQFIEDIQPDTIVLGGDQVDCEWISKFYRWSFEEWLYSTQKEFLWFKTILEDIKRLSPKTDIIRMDWNHEDRLRPILWWNKDRAVFLDYKAMYGRLISKYYRYNEFHKDGKLYRTHWIYHNDAHAKKHAMMVQKNVVYWHLHTRQTYCLASPVDEQAHISEAVSCLCNLNPEYMRNKPSGWLNWFLITYIRENGNFNNYHITITDWKFYFNNKMYWC